MRKRRKSSRPRKEAILFLLLCRRLLRPQTLAAPDPDRRDRSASLAAMELPPISSNPRTIEEIFKDFSSRRTAIIRALTVGMILSSLMPCSFGFLSDFSLTPWIFVSQRWRTSTLSVAQVNRDVFDFCGDLGVFIEIFLGFWFVEKDNLCLYGHSNQMWEVNLPADEVPPEMPEPALGINFARDGMDRKDWLSLVAVHSDSWLLSVAFYFAFRFSGNDRYRPLVLLDLRFFFFSFLC